MSDQRLIELSVGLSMAIGYLERMSTSKLRDPEGHKRILDKLYFYLESEPKVDIATAVVETATHVCDRAVKFINERGFSEQDESRKKELVDLASRVRGIMQVQR